MSAAAVTSDRERILEDAALRQVRRNRIITGVGVAVGRAFLIAALLGLWAYAAGRWVDRDTISDPVSVLGALGGLVASGRLWPDLGQTVLEVVAGYLAGATAGALFASLLALAPSAERVLRPFLIAVYAVPKIALAPLIVMWFGLGIAPKIILAGAFVFFIVFMNAAAGIESVNPHHVNIIRVMGAGRFAVLRKIVLPTAIPFLVLGMRLAVPEAMVGAVIGEFISANRGLGYVVYTASNELNTAVSMAALVVLVLVVALADIGLGMIEFGVAPSATNRRRKEYCLMDPQPNPTRMIERLALLVAANSENPPGREIEAARYLTETLQGIGLAVDLTEIADGRANVVARFENGAGPVFAFNSHMDVVPAAAGWSSNPFKLRKNNGRLYARGACDAKGPIVAMIEAVELLVAARERWSGTLLAVFVADEEVASRGARAYVASRPRLDLCIVGEPTSNGVVTAHKGSMRPLIRVNGVPAHSASPDNGVNAAYKAGPLLRMIEDRHHKLAASVHPLLGSPSLTVTRINGGHADNVTPQTCDLLLDRRMIPGETEDDVKADFVHLLAEAKVHHGIDAEIIEFRPTTGGATETAADRPIVTAALHAAGCRGGGTSIHGLQGACDLVHFRSLGAEGVVLGPGSLDVAHKPDEYIPEDEFVASSLIYRDTVLALLRRARATQ